ncbi:bifunctional Tetratricopeptide-like helical domain superfamily/Pre-mRNA-splicing factor Syf1-like/HAT (Half-A-TPR) repeat [Babesia duncani]|uniref:Bifunctional Tetratricopeptide-like helical domain superfamily/Pre-mRNA-splicing factor Syf1-like/HAT (Half-A-TPR) repeat n=1 Tax=Babesia duncani TaxID=323732 RepID=A0AAD9UPL6_9APIC|nr:bifunctional Tetratricopeptide-like helical domain superfamily/Pre-mRNA-splicing factor Syf1-like/HAT (Half-A-TPR) repeat [Babesia duncani]
MSKANALEVKNKLPAAVQITAEQILRDAAEYQTKDVRAKNRILQDNDELTYYKAQRRKEFEDAIRRQRHHIGNWIKYALWEANQCDFKRSRSVFERALQVDGTNSTIWLRYIETELKGKNVNAARNLFDRVTGLLPRVDQFWFKYAHFEQLLGNYAGARAVYERWMQWNPEDKGWMLYAKFEQQCGELERAAAIFERYLEKRPSTKAFLKFAKFQEQCKNIPCARAAYLKAIQVLPPQSLDVNFFQKYAQFEERCHNYTGAQHIYQEGIKTVSINEREVLFSALVSLQKRHCNREVIDGVILQKRRDEYEQLLNEAGPSASLDVWNDYIAMEQSLVQLLNVTQKDFSANPPSIHNLLAVGDDKQKQIQQAQHVASLYERAISNLPTIDNRALWRRYSYLWYSYAAFCEIQLADINRAIQVLQLAVETLPNDFCKPWILLAEALLRNEDLGGMRKTLGLAIAKCKRPKIFTTYAQLELQLGNVERARHVHAKYIETCPSSPESWLAFINLELFLGERDRTRALCEAAIAMDYLESPENVWNRYIEIEEQWQQYPMVRNIYERLLLKSNHIKVYKAYSEFEFKTSSPEDGRAIVQRGLDLYKAESLHVERAQLILHLVEMERQYGDAESLEKARSRRAKRVLKRSKLANGQTVENIVHVFPDDEQGTSKMLQAALRWKQAQAARSQA